MSTLGQVADVAAPILDVRFVPQAVMEVATSGLQQRCRAQGTHPDRLGFAIPA